jgi:membrane-bound lytic murein transglycosylase D
VTASVTIPSAVSDAPSTLARAKVVYRVKRGDTLSSIARVFQTTVASLKKWNDLPGNTVKIGQRLTIMTTKSGTLATH